MWKCRCQFNSGEGVYFQKDNFHFQTSEKEMKTIHIIVVNFTCIGVFF